MYRYVTTPTWRETIVRIAALLRLGIKQDIVQQVGVDRKRLEEEESIERKPGSGRPLKLDTSTIRDTVEAKPHKSIRSHAKDMAVSRTLVSRAIKKEGGKSLTMKKKPLLTDTIKETHLSKPDRSSQGSNPKYIQQTTLRLDLPVSALVTQCGLRDLIWLA